MLGAEALSCCAIFGENGDDRLLLVNLGRDLRLDPAPEPLLAPPEGHLWEVAWSSEDPRYGGGGTAPLETADNWRIPGHAAVVMRPVEPTGKHGRSDSSLAQARSSAIPSPTRTCARSGWSPTVWAATPPAPLRGAITRRYHGLLIAALPNPLGRMMMLNGLSERLRLPDRRVVYTGAEELAGITPEIHAAGSTEFRLEAGLPVWRYEVDGFVLEKRLLLPYRQNTVHITYQLLSGNGTLRLGLRPAIHFRSHDAPVSAADRQQVRPDRLRRPVRNQRTDRPADAAPDDARARLGLHFRSQGDARRSLTRSSRTAATSGRARCGVPGYFRSDLAEGDERHAGRVHRELGNGARPDARRRACSAELDRRKLLLAAPRRRRPSRARGRTGLRGRPVPDHAGRPRGRRRARARRRRRDPHASSPATTGSPIGAATP